VPRTLTETMIVKTFAFLLIALLALACSGPQVTEAHVYPQGDVAGNINVYVGQLSTAGSTESVPDIVGAAAEAIPDQPSAADTVGGLLNDEPEADEPEADEPEADEPEAESES